MKGASLVSLVLVAWPRAVAADDTASTAQSSSFSSASSTKSSSQVSTTSSIAAQLTEIPTDPRATYASEHTTFTIQSSTNATGSLSSFNQTLTSSSSSSSAKETLLHGATTASSLASVPTNSDARCNGYAEFCERKYSNITYVVAHNSPFHRANNAASNQDFDVTTQLDNGVRGSKYWRAAAPNYWLTTKHQ